MYTVYTIKLYITSFLRFNKNVGWFFSMIMYASMILTAVKWYEGNIN